jgi:hypothetical protein
MVGDVNIFIHDFDGEKHGELELMIAGNLKYISEDNNLMLL